jgi:hypothetical protein
MNALRANDLTFSAGTGKGPSAARRPRKRSCVIRDVVVSIRRREIWTTNNAGNNLAALDQRERDRVLLSPQKAFGSIDRIEGKKTVHSERLGHDQSLQALLLL